MVWLVLLACGSKEGEQDSSTREDTSIGGADTAQVGDSGMDDAGDSGIPEEPYGYIPPQSSLCDEHNTTDHGFLCALQPSRLDASARDQFADDSISNRNLGFGYHVVAFPHETTEIVGVYVHFTGSMGRAYNPNNGEYPSFVLLDEAMKAGFIVIQMAYHNRYAVNSPQECLGSNDIDDCAGMVRREKILGEDVGPVVDVPLSDAITHRLKTLVHYFETHNFVFPVSILQGDDILWQNLILGGHSQGSGHALFLAKYWDAAHVCLFGGPYDAPDVVPTVPEENIADWYLDETVVDISNVRGLVSLDDDNHEQFLISYNILHMQEGIHWTSFQAPIYHNRFGEEITGHAAVVHDPAFAIQRYETCFAYGRE